VIAIKIPVPVPVTISAVMAVSISALQLDCGRRSVRVISIHCPIAVIHGTDKNLGTALLVSASSLLLAIAAGIAAPVSHIGLAISGILPLRMVLVFLEKALFLFSGMVFIPGLIALRNSWNTSTRLLAVRGGLGWIAAGSPAFSAATETLFLPWPVRGAGICIRGGCGGLSFLRQRWFCRHVRCTSLKIPQSLPASSFIAARFHTSVPANSP